ncbi:hypothetical protein FSARC_5979 [Fusarium sarcochroum]|uniref:NACHT domain-containing protein n=1 Tax=Fusarium sarcochroum TaxID=1208366 RepID=A0A8H4TYD6_9HYPO|nr:hypothetical protein FSARC_5979 [Fusarium sarcochroum]
MEALAVASLTGNILQFIEFTSRMISSTHQISAAGSKKEHLELETIAEELRRSSRIINTQRLSDNVEPDSEADNTLAQISKQCIDVTDQLLAALNFIKRKSGASKAKNFYQALKSEWKAGEIEALQRRVDRIGDALNRHLMTSRQEQISFKLDQLAGENFRLQAGRADDIAHLTGRLEVFFAEMRYGSPVAEPEHLPPSAIFLETAERGAQYSIEQVVLKKLRFSAIDERYDTIPSAHSDTFSWIFKPEDQDVAAPSSFLEWLTSTDDLYWISGKPGSGKSTLMKFLCTHEVTKHKLCQWAHGNRTRSPNACHDSDYSEEEDRLLLGDFFFWNAGKKSLQKSQEGLLRALIYQILPCDLLQPSRARLCLFIDGLDEYEGKPSDIIGLVNDIRSIKNVKICVSSRPWNEFEQSFGQDRPQKLCMQDLTKEDIRKYVCDILDNDKNYQNLEEKDREGKELIAEIIEAAQGVFLWVVLVVRSFQEGLINGDRIVDLQTRLRDLPKDLNDYFEKILLSDVDDFYRPQSARMSAATLHAQQRLPLMAYWFLDQQDPEYALKLEVAPLDLQKMSLRLEQTRKRLNACCKGLLEVQSIFAFQNMDSPSSGFWFNQKVDFLHRTVQEFLLSPKTEAFLADWASSQTADMHIGICNALLPLIKIVSPEQKYFEHAGGVNEVLQSLFLHAKVLHDTQEYMNDDFLMRLLNNIDATLVEHGRKIGERVYTRALLGIQGLESISRHFTARITTFLGICIMFGLTRFVENKLNSAAESGDTTTTGQLPALLRLALSSSNYTMVKMLLQKGANPNSSFEESGKGAHPFIDERGTIWALYIRNLYRRQEDTIMFYSSVPFEVSQRRFLCIQELLKYGAPPDIVIRGHGDNSQNVRQLVREVLAPEHMAVLEHFFSGSQEGSKQDDGGKVQRQKISRRKSLWAIFERIWRR